MAVRLQLAPVAGVLDVVDEFDPLAPVASDSAEPDRLARAGLVESLRATPHVHVLRRGGTNFEPVVQGLRETQLAMVVDGTRTFAAGPARMDSELSHVDPSSVADVEVVTGPYAPTEGAGAMAAILVNSEPVPARQDWQVGGRGGIGWRSNGAGRMANARVDAGNSRLGFSLRATGDLLDDCAPRRRAGRAEALRAAVLRKRWREVLRSRRAGGGCKPPTAAALKRRGGERARKRQDIDLVRYGSWSRTQVNR